MLSEAIETTLLREYVKYMISGLIKYKLFSLNAYSKDENAAFGKKPEVRKWTNYYWRT